MARIVQTSNFNLDWFEEEFILGSMPCGRSKNERNP